MLLNLLDRFLKSIAEPFAVANSWKQYAIRSYWRFGFLTIVLLCLTLMLMGYIGELLSRSPAGIRPYVEFISQLLRLGELSKALPLLAVIFLIYLVAGVTPRLNDTLGGWLADFYHWLFNGLIGAGELCIKHRGASALIILALSSFLIFGSLRIFENRRGRALIEQSFGQWLIEVEHFIMEDPFYKLNNDRQERMQRMWGDNFKQVLLPTNGRKHPALLLHDAIKLFASPEKGVSYVNHLRSKRADFEKIAAACEQSQPGAPEAKACDLINIAMAKLYNRFADGNPKLEYFKESDKHYSRVDLARYRDRKEGRPYMFAVRNGKGTLYAGMFRHLIKNPPAGDPQLCETMAQCARRAYDVNSETQQYVDECSPQWRIRANNVTDLLSRFGLHYERIIDELDGELRRKARMQNKNEMQAHLEENIKVMMRCNEKRESLPDLLTVAQAYGTRVKLKGVDDPDAASLIMAAGTYLRLAHSFEPEAIREGDWDLDYFCFALNGGKLNRTFLAAFDAKMLSAVSASDPEAWGVELGVFKKKLGDVCQQATSHNR